MFRLKTSNHRGLSGIWNFISVALMLTSRTHRYASFRKKGFPRLKSRPVVSFHLTLVTMSILNVSQFVSHARLSFCIKNHRTVESGPMRSVENIWGPWKFRAALNVVPACSHDHCSCPITGHGVCCAVKTVLTDSPKATETWISCPFTH